MLDDAKPMEMKAPTSDSVHDVFNKIAAHMQKGLSVHEQLANYYDFLGMDGFSEEHAEHYNDEAQNLRRLKHYYVSNYDKMLNPGKAEDPTIIPPSWYRHTRNDVDAGTKRNGVENGLKEWREWENQTKHEYEKAYKQLMDMDETSAAFFVKDLLDGVSEELETVNRRTRNLKDGDYDLKYITEIQDRITNRNQNSGMPRSFHVEPQPEYRRAKRNNRYSYNTFDEYYK